MNLRDLRYLVAVADHRHFGRAAAACFVSQPTLSAQLKKLERELGVELIERNPRQIMVTATGERVVAHARTMLREADTINEIAQRSQDPEGGSVRMGLIPTVAPYLLPHVVPDLHRRFPHLELLLAEEKTEVALAQLREGRLDVAVLALPVTDDQLHVELLFSEEFVLAVPTGHPLAASDEPVDASVLADEPVLLLEEGHCLRDQALDLCRLVGASERDGFRATSLETLRQMVAAGVAVTLLPELAVLPPVPDSFDVCLRRFADPAPKRDIAMLWRRSSEHAGLYGKFAAVLRDAMAP
jgi:LysR family hydrogen peroxide-inducible transcriptional activator